MSFLVAGEGIDDPSDFQATAFQDLDEHFRCPICKEFFETTMILSTCSHSFCALCIRRSLNTEQNCPQCRKPAYESALIHNYALDHVVTTWRNSRSFILTADRNVHAPLPTPSHHSEPINKVQNNTASTNHSSNSLPIVFDTDDSKDFVPGPTKRSNSATTPVTRRSNRLSSQSKGKNVEVSPQVINVVNDLSSENIPQRIEPYPQFQQPIVAQAPTATVQSTELEALNNESMVECPICTQSMAMIVLNQHIDTCMKGDSRIPPLPSTATSSSKPNSNFPSMMSTLMPKNNKNKPIDLGRKPSKVVYALLSEKDLKKILRDLGLSDQGDRAAKIWRHKEYINLYNANYDSDSPVSANVLVQRLHMTEQLKINDQYNQLKRKATNLDEHQIAYKSQFDELIDNAKRNRMTKKNKDDSSQQSSNTTFNS